MHHSGHIKQKWLGPAFRVAESVEGNNGGAEVHTSSRFTGDTDVADVWTIL